MDVKLCMFNVVLEYWRTVQMHPGKESWKISNWPGIICVCKVMINGSIVFNSDGLDNFTQNQFKPWELKFTDFQHHDGILFFHGKPGILHPTPVWI